MVDELDFSDLTDPEQAEEGDLACEFCGRSPSVSMRMRSTGGYIVFRSMSSTPMITVCKECGLELLQSGQRKAKVGVLTVNPFAPYALAQNQKWVSRLNKLPDPIGKVIPTVPFGRFRMKCSGPSSPASGNHKCTVSVGVMSIQIQGPSVAGTILPVELVRKIRLKSNLFGRETAEITMTDGTQITLREADGSRTSGSFQAHRLVQSVGPLVAKHF